MDPEQGGGVLSGDLSAELGDEHLGDGAVVGREHAVQDTEHALLSTAPHVTRPACTGTTHTSHNWYLVLIISLAVLKVPNLNLEEKE
jgi:hypothetical protein